MYKFYFTFTYSLAFAFAAGIIFNSVIAAAVVGAISEIAIVAYIYRKLASSEEFRTDTIVGKLLSMYTISTEIGLWTIIDITGIRCLSYLTLAFSFMYYVPFVLLFAVTLIHYDN